MPRKNENPVEETSVVSTPSALRRSSRTAASGAGTPTTVKTRRGSLLVQENEEENVEVKPATRTQRAASVTKEEVQQKPEPAKTRSRRSSATSDLPPAEEKRPTRSRRPSATEDSAESLKDTPTTEQVPTRKTIRSRRSSAQEEKLEEDAPVVEEAPTRKTIKTRRNSAQEDKLEEPSSSKAPQRRKSITENEEPKGKATRSRRLSVEKSEELIEDPPKRATRTTRRNSVDKTEDEPEPKISKPSTPKKPRRRLSVTETVVPLEPINEQETDITKRDSVSPVSENIPAVKLTPVKKTEAKKTDLDLSVINETSFTDEQEGLPESVAPKAANVKATSISSTKSPNLIVVNEETNSNADLTPSSNLSLKDEESRLGVRRVSPRLNKAQLTPQKLSFAEDEEEIVNVKTTEDDSVFHDSQPTVIENTKPKTGTTISSGSDGSFNLHLSNSLMKTSSQGSQDDEVDLNTSNGSDKENIIPVTGKSKQMSDSKTLAALSDTANITVTNETYTVGRVSNVFRPNNVEYSFVEPMEVDKTVIELRNKINSSESENSFSETKEKENQAIQEASLKSTKETASGSDKLDVNETSSKTSVNESPEADTNSLGDKTNKIITQSENVEGNEDIKPAQEKQSENSSVPNDVSEPIIEQEKNDSQIDELKSKPNVEYTKTVEEPSKEEPIENDMCEENNAVVTSIDDQASENLKSKSPEISPKTESKLLEESLETISPTNKEEASVDFEFNIPSDEDNEEEQADPKIEDNAMRKVTDANTINESQKDVDEAENDISIETEKANSYLEKMDVSTDISVVIEEEDADKEKIEETGDKTEPAKDSQIDKNEIEKENVRSDSETKDTLATDSLEIEKLDKLVSESEKEVSIITEGTATILHSEKENVRSDNKTKDALATNSLEIEKLDKEVSESEKEYITITEGTATILQSEKENVKSDNKTKETVASDSLEIEKLDKEVTESKENLHSNSLTIENVSLSEVNLLESKQTTDVPSATVEKSVKEKTKEKSVSNKENISDENLVEDDKVIKSVVDENVENVEPEKNADSDKEDIENNLQLDPPISVDENVENVEPEKNADSGKEDIETNNAMETECTIEKNLSNKTELVTSINKDTSPENGENSVNEDNDTVEVSEEKQDKRCQQINDLSENLVLTDVPKESAAVEIEDPEIPNNKELDADSDKNKSVSADLPDSTVVETLAEDMPSQLEENLSTKGIDTIVEDNKEDTLESDRDTNSIANIEITVTAQTRTVVQKVNKKTFIQTEDKDEELKENIPKPEDKEDAANTETIDILSEDEREEKSKTSIPPEKSVDLADYESTDGSLQIIEDEVIDKDTSSNKIGTISKDKQTSIKRRNKRKRLQSEDIEGKEHGGQETSFKKKSSKLSQDSDEVEKKKSKKIKKSKRKSNLSNNDEDDGKNDNPEDEGNLLPSICGETLKTTNMSKLDQYLKEKMEETEEEDESDISGFIDDMAEEGEESTPSEDSNEIIDDGESINTTESDWSEGEYDDKDSFICDEENEELLSGEEYDLDDVTDVSKASRIINVEDSQDDVIIIPKKVKKANKKTKKSRIVNIDDIDDDVIKIGKVEKKRVGKTRIINVNDSGEQEVINLDKEESVCEKDDNTENELAKSAEDESDDYESAECEIVENESVSSDSVESESAEVVKTNVNKPDPNVSLKRASITIQENIKVSDIQDPALSSRINELVGTFSKTIRKGDVSVNLSMQYEGTGSDGSSAGDVICLDDVNKSEIKKDKRTKLNRSLKKKSDSEMSGSPAKKTRLSVSLNTSDYSDKTEEDSTSKRMSISTDDIHLKKMRKKKMKAQKKAKSGLLRGVQEKAIRKSLSADDLRAETFSLMSQLLNDVRNRPRRTVRPSTAKPDPNSSWIVDDVTEVKPSTSVVTSKDIAQFKANKKIHMKDFKSQMLNDPSRVKRIETQKLLKKKWA